MKKKQVAIYLSGVHDLKGGGGVERFFSDFFRLYSNYEHAKYEIWFFMDLSTFNALLEVGKLKKEQKNVVLLKNYSNRFKQYLENRDLKQKVREHNIEIFHCANYGRHDFNRLFFLSKLKRKRPKLVQNIVDCQIPYILKDTSNEQHSRYFERYVEQPSKIGFDGVFSWYQLYLEFFEEKGWFNSKIVKQSITSRFADIEKFKPIYPKERLIVFASRLHHQKKPLWFLESIAELRRQNIEELSGWHFLMYGNGEMKEQLVQFAMKEGLSEILSFRESGDLSEILPRTTCYVSTQDFENFPSLSMMEAMACGNIIVARDVGQTNLMVRKDFNGFVLERDSAFGLAEALKRIILLDDNQIKEMSNNSLKMISEIHTPVSFFKQIESFWSKLC